MGSPRGSSGNSNYKKQFSAFLIARKQMRGDGLEKDYKTLAPGCSLDSTSDF